MDGYFPFRDDELLTKFVAKIPIIIREKLDQIRNEPMEQNFPTVVQILRHSRRLCLKLPEFFAPFDFSFQISRISYRIESVLALNTCCSKEGIQGENCSTSTTTSFLSPGVLQTIGFLALHNSDSNQK